MTREISKGNNYGARRSQKGGGLTGGRKRIRISEDISAGVGYNGKCVEQGYNSGKGREKGGACKCYSAQSHVKKYEKNVYIGTPTRKNCVSDESQGKAGRGIRKETYEGHAI